VRFPGAESGNFEEKQRGFVVLAGSGPMPPRWSWRSIGRRWARSRSLRWSYPSPERQGPLTRIFHGHWERDVNKPMNKGARSWLDSPGNIQVGIVNPELRSWDGKPEKDLDRQRVGKATPGKLCTRWWQARRARSDAPYHAGRATRPFNFSANFGVRVNPFAGPENPPVSMPSYFVASRCAQGSSFTQVPSIIRR